MKQKYYVNDKAQRNGDHEVHVTTCNYFSMIANRTYLENLKLVRKPFVKQRSVIKRRTVVRSAVGSAIQAK